MRPAQRRLLIFCREPVAGRVKTRLIPSLGPQRAATLYSRLLETALDAAYGVENASTELWCDFLRESSVVCRGLATRYAMTLCRQQGKDLGERMYHAISTSTPPGPALLIGSDCPEYTSEYLSDGFAALADKDAVIGPATDGGYVMIGVNRIDYSGYPDCRPEFLEAFQRVADLGTRAGVTGGAPRVLAPLVDLSKAAIVELGLRLGVPFEKTISCYDAGPDGGACGACDACRLRREGFLAAGVRDPTRYA